MIGNNKVIRQAIYGFTAPRAIGDAGVPVNKQPPQGARMRAILNRACDHSKAPITLKKMPWDRDPPQ